MALKAVIDKLEDVAEGVRGEYRAANTNDGETLKGKFILDVTALGGLGLENVEGLKSALGKERRRADDAEGKVKGFGDLDPAKTVAALAELEDLKKLDPKKEADKLAEVKVQAATQAMKADHEKVLGDEKKRSAGYREQVGKLLVDNVATSALTEHKGSVELLLPIIKSNTRLKETDSGFEVEVVDVSGNVRFGKDAKPMTVAELVADLKADAKFGRAFDASGKSGSGTPQNPNGGMPKSGSSGYDASKTRAERVAAIDAKVQGNS